MIRFLLKVFLSEEKAENEIQMRTKYSVFAGVLGIVCNLLLFVAKLISGISASSIAIISDAFNNLSDSGTSIVSIIGAKLSAKRPDREHPLGHGRVEYISSLIVAFIISIVGFELLKASFEKILNPSLNVISPLMTTILILSVLVKWWMYSYNRYLGRLINSSVLMATARDSINDVIATSAVILSSLLGKKFGLLMVDGIVGIVVSVMITYSGVKIALDTIGVLLGEAPNPELTEGIRKRVLEPSEVMGVHDLIVHDYGPGRILASVHAEVSADIGIVEIHEVIDAIEKRIKDELGVHIVVHMDPVMTECQQTAKAREMVIEVVKTIDERLSIHDFKMTEGKENLNLIFDIDVPLGFDNIDEVEKLIVARLKEKDPKISPIISFDFV